MEEIEVNREKDPQTICTTLAQSRTLEELGLSTGTSDMTWSQCRFTPTRLYGEEHYMLFCYPGAVTSHDPTGTPAWSTDKMLSILPAHVCIEGKVCHIQIHHYEIGKWSVLYRCNEDGQAYASSIQPNMRDAAYEMLKWYLQNKPQVAYEE